MSHNANVINAVEPTATGAFSVTGRASFVRFGQGESDNYANSGATSMDVNAEFFFYDTAPLNSIAGSTFNSGWVSSFTLPAGKYQITYQSHVVFSATGVCGIGLYNASGVLVATPMQIGSVQASNNGVGFLNLATASTFTFRVAQASNVSAVGSQGNTPSEYGHIFILRVQ